MNANCGIAFHQFLRLGHKLDLDVSEVAKDLFRADEIERSHARIDQHSDSGFLGLGDC